MKFLISKLMALSCLALCADFITPETNPPINIDSIYACPRCRRNQPKGPRKRPTPPGPRSDRAKNVS